MTAYYNEIEPFAADWLRRLIARGLIAPGDVDTRSIVDVRPDDLRSYTQCHFFAGIGGWSYALRSAGWDDDRPVWTGSCPCQPFSLAGKQKGFDDPRHLWPVWRELIRECDPAVVFGEQVASATDWLGLVRSDLEGMGRAVGAMPIQAASAGADHLRDRYWFVAHTDDARSQGWRLLPERAGERLAGPDGVADADQLGAGAERAERGRQLCGVGCDQGARDSCDMADALCSGARDAAGCGDCSQGAPIGIDRDASRPGAAAWIDGAGSMADAGSGRLRGSSERQVQQPRRAEAERTGDLNWVIGADEKARRVKPGLRLLAHGVSGRVGKLRGFGNAIDPRPAATFIEAADYAMSLRTESAGPLSRDNLTTKGEPT